MRIENVAIIGKGALGMLFGSLMAAHLGEGAVKFVMDDARYARHQGEVLTVNGVVCDVPTIPLSQATPVDLVIVAVKSTGLDAAIDSIEPLVKPHTRIVSVLNGVTSEQRIAARYGWENVPITVAQGMDAVFIGSELTYSQTGELHLGAAAQTAPETIDDLVEFFTRTQVPFVVEDDIQHRLWTKFMLNVGVNQTCMVYGSTYADVIAPGEQNRCFIAAMRETLAVGRAEGVNLSEADLTEMARLIETLDPTNMPSMAQDRLNGKRTEVEEFSGTIIRLAEKHDILVPCNRFLYERVREIEAQM